MPMSTRECCEFLSWDSEFFGQRIARVSGDRLDRDSIQGIDRWCHENAIDCLYFLADAKDAETLRLAECSGYHLVDVRLTFERQIRNGEIWTDTSAPTNGAIVRPFAPNDLAALQALARDSYRDSRFYFDPCFRKSHCDMLYETWIRRSCEGYADVVLVAEMQDRPVGYITGHLRVERREGQIGLVGVNSEARGFGIGMRLVRAVLNWFAVHRADTAIVVTQGRNVSAQRMYQRCGFLTREMKLWYHKWFIDCGQELGK